MADFLSISRASATFATIVSGVLEHLSLLPRSYTVSPWICSVGGRGYPGLLFVGGKDSIVFSYKGPTTKLLMRLVTVPDDHGGENGDLCSKGSGGQDKTSCVQSQQHQHKSLSTQRDQQEVAAPAWQATASQSWTQISHATAWVCLSSKQIYTCAM